MERNQILSMISQQRVENNTVVFPAEKILLTTLRYNKKYSYKVLFLQRDQSILLCHFTLILHSLI